MTDIIYNTDSTRTRGGSFSQNKPKVLRPFDTSEVKILLLENVNTTAVEAFRKQGYQVSEYIIHEKIDVLFTMINVQVETYAKALVGEELIEKIKDVHVVGIRSKTKLTKAVLDEAKNLLAIGCFCIGTNQVDLKHAANKGVSE